MSSSSINETLKNENNLYFQQFKGNITASKYMQVPNLQNNNIKLYKVSVKIS
jgi:hypothetical protein